jgi:hypothetical protein
MAHYQHYKEILEKDYGTGEASLFGIKINRIAIQIAK